MLKHQSLVEFKHKQIWVNLSEKIKKKTVKT